jgi:Copper type II ascorbate-dependent monooxygenase, C-terminal domain
MNSLIAGRPGLASLARERAEQRAFRPRLIAALVLTAVAVQGCAGGEEPVGAISLPSTADAGFFDAGAPPPLTGLPPVGSPDTGIAVQPTRDAGAAAASSGLPCNIEKIVAAKCAVTCHTDPPMGTPTALTKQAYWLQTANSDKTKKYFELAKVRVNAANNPMPPTIAPQLTAEEKTALNTWLNAGAPASTESCAPIVAATPDGGVPVDPSKIDTAGLDCYKFLAHAQGNKNAKYPVGAAVDKYMFFGFAAPWQGTVYGKVVKPITDNSKALHHWLLYKENVADGSVQETIGQHNGGELIHGWAPGGIAMDFRKHGDVSFELGSGTYGLELHYNSSDASAMDASGAEVCVQKTKTTNLATMTWLGYDQGGVLSYASGGGLCLEADTMWTGTCKPASFTQPIHIIFMTPHLHQTGRHLKSVINGPSGSRVLIDKPFDFNYQVSYESEEVLMPGESITTTCTFSEPKCAGQSTSQEMCYNFTYAWPAHALVDNGPEGTLMHGKGVCLGQ